MGDPSFGLLPSADTGAVNQSPPPFLPGVRPFLQAPPLGLLPNSAAFVSNPSVVPHVGARGQSSLLLDTSGLSYQMSPPSVGQFSCPSTVAFTPTTFIPLSNPVEPSLGPPVSSTSTTLTTLSLQLESFSQLAQKMHALAQAL